MLRHIILLYLVCLSFLLRPELEAQDESTHTPLPTLSEFEVQYFQIFVQGNNRFAFDLYQRLKNQPGNLYFSPYSIVSGLGLIAAGAKGETAHQFQQAFHYSLSLLLFIGDLNESLQKPSASKNANQVLLANALWMDQSLPILPSFKQILLRNFRTAAQPVDFKHNLSRSIQKINQWILQHTDGKINNMVLTQDATVNTQMILTTAASMKEQWAYPFDPSLTKRQSFYLTNQRSFLAEMMQNTADYLIWKGEQWEMLILPFEKGNRETQLGMAILVPKKDVSLAELEKNLTWENWRQWKNQLQSQKITLTFPRVRIEKRLDLEPTLKALGFSLLFNPEADFSGITEKKGVYLNQAVHKSSIRFEEEGTERTMVRGIKRTATVKTESSNEFTVDRPFIFIIWDQKTDVIVFMGRLALP
jgi:serpin B